MSATQWDLMGTWLLLALLLEEFFRITCLTDGNQCAAYERWEAQWQKWVGVYLYFFLYLVIQRDKRAPKSCKEVHFFYLCTVFVRLWRDTSFSESWSQYLQTYNCSQYTQSFCYCVKASGQTGFYVSAPIPRKSQFNRVATGATHLGVSSKGADWIVPTVRSTVSPTIIYFAMQTASC